ncbi:MAG: lantibiotic dehydratase [Ktedonobacteraceae bacterium]|nr:lantibiotic dehydratase [Ktedonobacteraceae bacterium]
MSAPWYRPASFYLLRVPTLPSTLFAALSHSGHIDLLNEQNLESAWQHARQASLTHIAQLAASPLVEQALLVASPSLYEALRQQNGAEDCHALRAYERLLRYLIRMSSRPTPFGYCAGVAFGTFAAESNCMLEFERAGIRPDMRWLFTVVSSMEARFLPSLKVQVIPALLSFGIRGIGLRAGKDERVWFRMTPVFHRLCHYARMPIPYADLKQALLTDFPQATEGMVEAFLSDLYTIGVLLTTLPPADEHDPLGHVLGVLRPIAEASAAIVQLEAIQEAIQEAPRSIHALSALIHQQRAFTPLFEDMTVQVDMHMHLSQNTLSDDIGREAAKVAETLLRLGMYPHGIPSLHHARRIFLGRYEEQEVPLLTLFSPQGEFDTLYEKESDLGDLSQAQQERMTQRARLLRTLAMQAVNARENSLTLTPDLVERLSLWSPSEHIPPPLLDLYMQVYATSTEAIDHGDWQGLVTLLSLGGRSYRRFLHLFGEQEQAMVRDMLHAGDALFPEHLCATLAVLPPHVRDVNVMHGPLWSAYVIPINRSSSQPPEQTILPDDLLVSVRNGRFCLRSRFHNKAVRVTQPHMLSFLHLPPLARFLLEASRDGEPFPGPFQWGKAGTLPFLPRLTLGKIIVSLAQWTLSPEVLTSAGQEAGGVQWFRELQHWREHWRVPRYVYFVEGEDRLLLDLEHPLMVDILQREFAKTKKAKKSLTLQEAFFHEREGWIRDKEGNPYFSEVVIPLIRTTVSPKLPLSQAPHRVISDEERRFLPGQEWLYLKLYIPKGLHHLVLTGPLPSFIQRYRSLFDDWFFSRYQDPQAHIRVRLHANDEQQRSTLLQALLTWCQELQREGLLMRSLFDTYEREIERYGGPEAISTIEHIFCASSEAVCALLAGQRESHPPLFEAVYALDRLWADWGSYDLSARYHALQRFLPPGKESQVLRQQRHPLLAFLEHPPESISCIFDKQGVVLAQAGRAIRQLAELRALWRTEEEILWSLSHMLCNRLMGTRRKYEQEAYAAWYATLKVRYHVDR